MITITPPNESGPWPSALRQGEPRGACLGTADVSAVEEAQRSLSCVAFSGGGQPYPAEGVNVLDPDLLRQRASALYSIDSKKRLRKSYENPAIEEVFSSFLGGPGSDKAHELLHTHYQARLPRGVR